MQHTHCEYEKIDWIDVFVQSYLINALQLGRVLEHGCTSGGAEFAWSGSIPTPELGCLSLRAFKR